MNCENIKKGDHVLIPGVVQREPDGDFLYVEYKCGSHRRGLEYFRMAEVSKYLIFPPENGTKNTEPAPKYDPCRKFRKGDNVSPCFWNDRPPTAYNINEITAHFMPEDGLYIVNKDEFPDSTVLVEYKGEIISMQACHLELLTPEEEIEQCREFRIGDVVRVRKIHGNLPQCRYNGRVKVKEGDCCTIHDKEHRNCYWITTPSGNWCFDIAYFELVTPVELDPYRVGTGIDSQLLYCNNELFAEFEKTKDAKRVCALLNAEHRKEQQQ